ncbi:MAG TPA: DivIVA domain-containing protein [Solirubrobacteraceae bacterium]
MDSHDIARLRSPGFTLARRGYDKHEVDKFLEQLVDWLETDAANDIGHPAVKRKLELVGKSTAHILLTAEQEAEELRRLTETECAELRAEAEADANGVREDADTYATEVRARAEGEARQTREEANAEASETIEEGLRRRGQIDDEIHRLEAHRDTILRELTRLRSELAETIDEHAPSEAGEPVAQPAPER